MKENAKPTAALILGLVLSFGVLGQTSQAQVIDVESGQSVLADSFGTSSGPEALIVDWSVTEELGVYTYAYTVNNPVGDELLNSDGSPTGTPEIVDTFEVGFNTTAPAFIAGTQSGGVYDQSDATGLTWYFTAVQAGSSSPELSFQSADPPTLGNANAQDANPPSPWSSFPDGQQVPVPGTTASVPEPGIPALLALAALLLIPFRKTLVKSLVATTARNNR